MIAGWYGSIRIRNEDKSKSVLNISHLFKMHSVEKIITSKNALLMTHLKYSAQMLLLETSFSIPELTIIYCAPLARMCLTPDKDTNFLSSTQVWIKLAHLLIPKSMFGTQSKVAL